MNFRAPAQSREVPRPLVVREADQLYAERQTFVRFLRHSQIHRLRPSPPTFPGAYQAKDTGDPQPDWAVPLDKDKLQSMARLHNRIGSLQDYPILRPLSTQSLLQNGS